jgi:phage tail sheath protein FI
MSASKDRKTPGVYVTEFSAFPTSIVGVETAVPIFVGYTETASTRLTAVQIGSLSDYAQYFGGAYDAKYDITAATGENPPADFQAGSGYWRLKPGTDAQFNLFMAIKLFYANGGGKCYVVSTGGYGGGVVRQELLDGLDVARDTVGPTMLVVPDACLLAGEGDYSAVAVAAVDQSGALRDRVAILDLPGAMDPASWTKDGLAAQRSRFYAAIAPAEAYFSYGTAYAPALRTSVLSSVDIDYTNLQATQAGSDALKGLLQAQAEELYGAAASKLGQVQEKLDLAFPPDITKDSLAPAEITSLNQYLVNALPLLEQIETIVIAKLNVAPPSGAMAGIWASNDSVRGVWNAPANLAVAGVVAPEVLLGDADQEAYAFPLNGNAINILRSIVDRGTVVWGARTLDGNSLDYRYIQVRRTLVYIEQSIKTALQPFVFAANDAQTWSAVTGLISNFLTQLWLAGGLIGARSSEAYAVQCGMGSTMTEEDVVNGYMIVQVTLQMIHPAEFIELTFKQTMQGA